MEPRSLELLASFGLDSFFRLECGPGLLEYFLVRLDQQRIVCPCSDVLSSVHVCVVRNVLYEDNFCRVGACKVHYRHRNVSDLYDLAEFSGDACVRLVHWCHNLDLCSSISSLL